jgi:quinol monooxygenase YgiN
MNNKIFTIVEAEVDKEHWGSLKDKYNEVDKNSLPNSLLESHLVQDLNKPEVWRIITIWESLESITQYKASVETPAWILVFQSVNADPKLMVNEIVYTK